jgi:hypothetical protein
MKMKNYIDTQAYAQEPDQLSTMGIDYMAVKSDSFALYKAFKEECEKLGWKYNEKFSEFTHERALVRDLNCMYFSYDFDYMQGEPAFSLSYTSLKSFQLPQQWYQALKCAKDMLEVGRNTVQLNEDYTARVDAKRKVVTVGCQEFSFDKVLELAKIINKSK